MFPYTGRTPTACLNGKFSICLRAPLLGTGDSDFVANWRPSTSWRTLPPTCPKGTFFRNFFKNSKRFLKVRKKSFQKFNLKNKIKKKKCILSMLIRRLRTLQLLVWTACNWAIRNSSFNGPRSAGDDAPASIAANAPVTLQVNFCFVVFFWSFSKFLFWLFSSKISW